MKKGKGCKILFINSGATITGVPLLFISFLKWIKHNTSIEAVILTDKGGPLEPEYHKLFPTYRWDGWDPPLWHEKYYLLRIVKKVIIKLTNYKYNTYKSKLTEKIIKEKFDLIYINSVGSFHIYDELKSHINTKVICHVHELQMSIIQFCNPELFKANIEDCDHFITISDAVSRSLNTIYGVPIEKMTKVYTFINTEKAKTINQEKTKLEVRKLLNIPIDSFLVGSSGTTDWRKGPDLLIHIAGRVKSKSNRRFDFVWIGGDNSDIEYKRLNYDLEKSNLGNCIQFLGTKTNPLEYFAAIDAFLLCSREEPVGMVALEAASLGKPILCFENAGGMPEFVQDECGFTVPYLDMETMAERIILLSENHEMRKRLGEQAADKVLNFDINDSCEVILSIIENNLN